MLTFLVALVVVFLFGLAGLGAIVGFLSGGVIGGIIGAIVGGIAQLAFGGEE
jgi:hypothetical protein